MALTVTTWNVENFSSAAANFDAKCDYLVQTIQNLDPDVVALQEVLDQGAIDTLAQRLNYTAVTGQPDGRGIRVGLLLRNGAPTSQADITAWQLPNGVVVQSFDNSGALKADPSMPRAALQATFKHQNSDITAIVVHLKSKLLTFPGGHFSTSDESLRSSVAYFALQRRDAESKTVREVVNGLLGAGKKLLVMGDFNDGSEAATTEIFYGPTGGQPRGPEDATAEAGAFQRADQEDVARLFNVTKFAPEELRWSRKYNQQKELLDQILASEALMPRQGQLRKVPEIDIRNTDSPNIGDRPRDDSVIPDHAPVTARFQI